MVTEFMTRIIGHGEEKGKCGICGQGFAAPDQQLQFFLLLKLSGSGVQSAQHRHAAAFLGPGSCACMTSPKQSA